MDVEKVSKAIAYLRKRAGYTQKDLADRIGISDKAVSKWERGLGLPEIGYLSKLSILLGTDTDSLLTGNVIYHNPSWQGMAVLDQNLYGIGAETIIYDKPLIDFLLSYFLLMGIRNITVFCSEKDKHYLERRFQDGEAYGFHLSAVSGGLGEAHVKAKNIMMVYGRCILYGVDQTRFFQKAMDRHACLTMMVLPKKPGGSRVLCHGDFRLINTSTDEPLRSPYEFSDIPILFFPASLLPDMSNASNIASYVRDYAAKHDVYVQVLDRGFVEFEADSWTDVQEASAFMKIVQDRCEMYVYCIEEVAWRRGLISGDQLRRLGENHKGTEYGKYILSLYEKTNSTLRLPQGMENEAFYSEIT